MENEKKPEEPVVTIANPIKNIYADRVINLVAGPAVSKLVLGVEDGQGKFTVQQQLIMPTSALIDAVAFLMNTLQNNNDLKKTLTDSLTVISKQIADF